MPRQYPGPKKLGPAMPLLTPGVGGYQAGLCQGDHFGWTERPSLPTQSLEAVRRDTTIPRRPRSRPRTAVRIKRMTAVRDRLAALRQSPGWTFLTVLPKVSPGGTVAWWA